MKLPDTMIVLDIEATCWDHSADEGLITRVDDNETIEIGALAVSEGEILAGVSYRIFRQWCKETAPDAVCMVSWGKYDWTQLYKDCLRHNCGIGFETHLNMKEVYRRRRRYLRSDMSGKKRLGLQSAVLDLGLSWLGTAHRALADAKMVVAVYQEMRLRKVVT
jgi:inhibitor of KinA sporulation pathway (predicted exonuclease)